VLLTKKDSFFTAAQFSQLLFNAATPWRPGGASDTPLSLPPPAILKPAPLWTGKQVMSALVAHVAGGRAPLTFTAGGKVPADYWGRWVWGVAGAGRLSFDRF
jgi:DNA-directed RNA polymerase I subunit RPA1